MASAMHPHARGAHGHLIRWTAAGAITVAAVAIAIAIAIARAPAAATATPHLTLAAEAVATQGPLEFTEVALSQQDVRMSLRVATSGAWTAAAVVANELCVTLVHGAPALARGRICLTRRDGRAALSYAPLNEDGTAQSRPVMASKGRDGSIWRFKMGERRVRGAPGIRVAELTGASGGRYESPVTSGVWETSGIIDASEFFGDDSWLFDVQAHPQVSPSAKTPPDLVEDGQLLLMTKDKDKDKDKDEEDDDD